MDRLLKQRCFEILFINIEELEMTRVTFFVGLILAMFQTGVAGATDSPKISLFVNHSEYRLNEQNSLAQNAQSDQCLALAAESLGPILHTKCNAFSQIIV